MTDFRAALAEFAVRQAERQAGAQIEIEHLKGAVIPPLRAAGITRVEIRLDGYGDSGAIEQCVCYNDADTSVPCPDASVEPFREECSDRAAEADLSSLEAALESLGYLALERHHPGWENNEGAYGELVIDVAEASFTLDCNLRFTTTDDHSTEL